VADALAGRPDVLRAADLDRPQVLRERLRSQADRARAGASAAAPWLDDPRAGAELALLEDRAVVERTQELWAALRGRLAVVEPEVARAALRDASVVVFEGAQGVLLDERWGFHPHTTWSDCTPAGALALLEGLDARASRVGVLRAYATRHGEGPFPTEDPTHPGRADPTNDDAGWQGPFRAGPQDLVLLRYALGVSGGADLLAVSCLDRAGDPVPICRGYEVPDAPDLIDRDGADRRLRPGAPDDLGHRARLGDLLRRARPVVEPVAAADLPSVLEAALGVPVGLEGRGPRATDWRWRAMMPHPRPPHRLSRRGGEDEAREKVTPSPQRRRRGPGMRRRSPG
jgi:adenylosuccinate synthase